MLWLCSLVLGAAEHPQRECITNTRLQLTCTYRWRRSNRCRLRARQGKVRCAARWPYVCCPMLRWRVDVPCRYVCRCAT